MNTSTLNSTFNSISIDQTQGKLKGKKALNYRRLVQDSTSRFLRMA